MDISYEHRGMAKKADLEKGGMPRFINVLSTKLHGYTLTISQTYLRGSLIVSLSFLDCYPYLIMCFLTMKVVWEEPFLAGLNVAIYKGFYWGMSKISNVRVNWTLPTMGSVTISLSDKMEPRPK